MSANQSCKPNIVLCVNLWPQRWADQQQQVGQNGAEQHECLAIWQVTVPSTINAARPNQADRTQHRELGTGTIPIRHQ
jgi:hypothetical protein